MTNGHQKLGTCPVDVKDAALTFWFVSELSFGPTRSNNKVNSCVNRVPVSLVDFISAVNRYFNTEPVGDKNKNSDRQSLQQRLCVAAVAALSVPAEPIHWTISTM